MPAPKRRAIPALALRTAIAPSSGEQLNIDRENGVIYNVSVIAGGATRPSGNGQGSFDVDGVALQQIADAINASEIGIKSRLTHPELDGLDDLPCRLGYVRNARVIGTQVRADMHFHAATDSRAIQLMDIAATDPVSCGLSISALTATVEPNASTPTGLVLRVTEVDAVDWVGEPAANPAGLLSAPRNRKPSPRSGGLNLQEFTMNEQQKDFLRQIGLPYDASDEQTAAFIEALSDEQKEQFAALKEAPAVEAAAEAAEAEGDAAPAATTEVAATVDDDEEKEKPSGVTAGAQRNKAGASGGIVLTEAELDQRLAVARRRVREHNAEVRSIALRCGYDEKWINKHINAETPIDDVRRVALASLNRDPSSMQTTCVSVGSDLNRDTLDGAVQDAIMLRAGRRNFVQFDDRGVVLSADNRPQARPMHDRASEFRGHSVLEIGRRYLIQLGYREADRMDRVQLAGLLFNRAKLAAALPGVYLAHSTGDFPYLLADAMGKVLRTAYALAPSTWQMWCNRTTAPDFKDIKKLQLSEAADLVEILEDDEYEYGTLSESRETYALSTYGKGVKYTRRMAINDDTSAFDRIPTLFGNAAARKVEGLAVAILTANAALADTVALFATAHANLITGVPTVTSLGAGRAAMRKQTALGSDDPLELMPKFAIVPEAVFTTMSQLVSSAVDPALANATNNPFANQLQVISSPRLDTDSAIKWYLVADPSQIDTVDVCFLEGQEAPVVEEEDEFDTDSVKIKVRQECAAKAIDYRGFVRSNGS